MSKDKLEVISAAQTDRIERIKSYHQHCIRSFNTQMGYAFLCGAELSAAKAEVPHGQFTEWRERYLPQIPARSATRYIQFAEALAQNGHLADLKQPLRLCDSAVKNNGTLTDKEQEAVLKAVHEVADGKTLTQLYRDLGVIREPKDPNATPRKTVKLTEEEKVAAELAAAEALVDATIEQIATCQGMGEDEGVTLSRVKLAKRKELLAASTALNKLLRKLCKGKAKTK